MNPTYQNYATHDESEFPHLWEGVVGAWAPCLGPSGTRLHEHSGRNGFANFVNITAANGWTVQDGTYALNLSASNNQHLEATNAGRQFDLGASGFAVSTWCRPTAAATLVGRDVVNLFFSSVASPPYISYGIEYRSSNNWTFSIGVNGTTYVPLVTTASYAANSLYHVVGVYTGTRQQVYVNGVLAADAAESRPVLYNGNSLFIGRYTGYAEISESFVGQVFEVLLHRRALLPNEIRELFEIGRGGMYTPRRRRRAYSFGPSFLAAWARGSNVILQPCGVN